MDVEQQGQQLTGLSIFWITWDSGAGGAGAGAGLMSSTVGRIPTDKERCMRLLAFW